MNPNTITLEHMKSRTWDGWQVTDEDPSRKRKGCGLKYYFIQCTLCGRKREKSIRADYLRRNTPIWCPCRGKMKYLDASSMIGNRYERMTVIGLSEKGEQFVRCRCDCGTVKDIRKNDLQRGLVKGCNCLRDEKTRERIMLFCPNYDPDLTDEERNARKYRNDEGYGRFIRAVLSRDKGTCQICGSKENIEVHHLYAYKSYVECRTKVWNGVCLCSTCHDELHSMYGNRGDNTANHYYAFRRKKLGLPKYSFF